MPATSTAEGAKTKKTSPKKAAPLSRAIALQRAGVVEKRILRLEGKLSKDRELYERYTAIVTTTACDPAADTTTETTAFDPPAEESVLV